MELFTVNRYYLPLMEKFVVNNYSLPLTNLKNIIEDYYRLIKTFTVN